ncbi:MAG: hypothetical protein V4508_15255 [Pseudomonadota bacterium]
MALAVVCQPKAAVRFLPPLRPQLHLLCNLLKQAPVWILPSQGLRMKPNESMKEFQDFAAAKGIDLNASTPREGFEVMLEFRTAVACAVCSDDMLLYQWGSYAIHPS